MLSPQFPTGDTSFEHSQGTFVTRNVGWYTAIWSDTNSNKVYNGVFKTIDGGYTWQLMKRSGPAGLFCLFGLDSLNMWVYQVLAGILFTNDGGVTWDTSSVDTFYNLRGGYIYFFNSQEGLVFGKSLFYTTDGCKTWSIKSTDSNLVGNAEKINFVTREKGWIASGGHPTATDVGFIAATTDGGTTWNYQLDSNGIAPIAGINFIDSLTGYAVGYNVFRSGGVIYSTTDGGQTWSFKNISWVYNYSDVKFIDKQRGWITARQGKIWQTVDGGLNWTLIQTGTTADLKSISILKDERVAYVFGNNKTILRAELTTSTGNDNVNQPAKFTLQQNYPNPFNPTTEITYGLPENANVFLTVYNVLGQEVLTLVNKFESTGYKTVSFDANTLPSGVYFYRIQAGQFTDIKKMSLVK